MNFRKHLPKVAISLLAILSFLLIRPWIYLWLYGVVPEAIEDILEPRALHEIIYDSSDSLIVCTTKQGIQTLFHLSTVENTIRELGSKDVARFFPVVSEDGTLVAFCEQTQGAKSAIRVLNLHTNESWAIDDAEQDLLWPSLSSENDFLVYAARAEDGTSSIRMNDIEHQSTQILTSGALLYAFPRFSENDAAISFMRSEWFGRYSPVGTEAYHSWDLYELQLKSQTLRKLTDEDLYQIRIQTSTQSERYFLIEHLAYMSSDHFLLVDKTGIEIPRNVHLPEPEYNRRGFLDDPQQEMRNAEFSPDGKKLLFLMKRRSVFTRFFESKLPDYEPASELYLYDLGSNETAQLTHLSRHIICATYSPDGTRIAFLADTQTWNNRNALSLWIMNSDGSDLKMIRDSW